VSGIACSPLSLVFSLGSDFLGLLAHAGEQANAVACRVCEESEPAHLGDLGLRLQRLATKRLSLGKSGVDVVGGDVNEHFAGLVGGIFTDFDEATAGARIWLEHGVIKRLVDLDVPPEEVCIELSCCGGVLRRNFDVNDGMV
jgi:hypothetical protein